MPPSVLCLETWAKPPPENICSCEDDGSSVFVIMLVVLKAIKFMFIVYTSFAHGAFFFIVYVLFLPKSVFCVCVIKNYQMYPGHRIIYKVKISLESATDCSLFIYYIYISILLVECVQCR